MNLQGAIADLHAFCSPGRRAIAPEIKTVVPFAPQKQGEVHFYKPKYSVPLDKMINDPIDAKATRYWNHKAIVKSGEPFKFTFPTAADSHTYTVVVNGVDGEGNPISGVWTVEN